MSQLSTTDYSYKYKDFHDFHKKFNEFGKHFFLAIHRGAFEAAPENSFPAIQRSIDQGIFIIEIDVHKTKDGIVILMHDDTVDRMTNGSGKISELTYEQINELFLKENNGGDDVKLTKEKVPTLFEVMNLVKGKAIVNIDKCWEVREEVYDVLAQTDTLDYGLIKSDAKIEEVESFLNSKEKKPLYMHKVNEGNFSQLDEMITKIRPIAFEVAFEHDDSPCISDNTINKMKEHANVWVNSLNVSINGGHTDSLSLKNPDAGWGWLINKGVNIIQTDYAFKLQTYIDEIIAK
jgi:glycerophosphoryl diester phosphodiesterase